MMYGIDFGTSNTVVTVRDGTGSRLLDLGAGTVVPSLLYFEKDRRASIGDEAVADYTEALGRFKGQGNLYQHFRFFQALKLALKNPLFRGTTVFGTFFPAESLAGLFLREVKQRADRASGVVCNSAVLGRPVMLSEASSDGRDDERVLERYRAACAYAGFSDVSFVPEPVAAAAGIAAGKAGGGDGIVLVFDFGGGTLDVAIARRSGSGRAGSSMSILGSSGHDLGGYLLNEDVSRARIIRHFGSGGKFRTMKGSYLDMPSWITDQVASFYALPLGDIAATRKTVKDLVYDARPVDKPKLRGLLDFLDRNQTFSLFEAIDGAKIRLSDEAEANIDWNLPPHLSIREPLSRVNFEAIVAPRVVQARFVVEAALSRAGIRAEDVGSVIRVGGSSRVPAFVAMLEEMFPGRVSEGEVFTSIASGLLAAHDAGLSIT
ncbi:MAG: hypothetical protein A2Y38_26165 [Spirochaetes bacterium GWB1_59_5]|nr:MAG: hypothetical protein A2Y38_26165 [Spirochaetes bacterium GWB1_59_5]